MKRARLLPGSERVHQLRKRKMQQILLIVEVPPGASMTTGPAYGPTWIEFLEVLSSNKKASAGARKIREGSWLTSADGALPFLAMCTSEADRLHLPYTVFLLPDEPVELSKKPPIAARVQLFNV
jgi:hypothetical protein